MERVTFRHIHPCPCLVNCFSHIRLFCDPICPWDSLGKVLEWVAISFSRGFFQPRDGTHNSYVSFGVGSLPLVPPRKPLHLGNIYIPFIKERASGKLLYNRELSSELCTTWGGGMGDGGRERGIYVYSWLIHIFVQQKQTQHCETTMAVGCMHAQSCLNICDPMDYSLPGSSVHGIFQARILEWVAISYSRGSF